MWQSAPCKWLAMNLERQKEKKRCPPACTVAHKACTVVEAHCQGFSLIAPVSSPPSSVKCFSQ